MRTAGTERAFVVCFSCDEGMDKGKRKKNKEKEKEKGEKETFWMENVTDKMKDEEKRKGIGRRQVEKGGRRM